MFGLGSKKISEAGVWTDDSDVNNCQQCNQAFGLLIRKRACAWRFALRRRRAAVPP
jgi:hypothetical protein